MKSSSVPNLGAKLPYMKNIENIFMNNNQNDKLVGKYIGDDR